MAAASKSVLAEQALKWIAEAKTDFDRQRPVVEDAYRYLLPHRRRPGQTQQQHDQDDLFDSTGNEALADFAADMHSTFTPVEDDWLDMEPAGNLPEFTKAQLAAPLKAYQSTISAEIRRSNFHEASQESYPDLGIGTCAMVIQDFDINEPIMCQAIPITDLLICRGKNGGVDFRCRVIGQMKLRDIPTTYPNAKLSAELRGKIQGDPGSTACVQECCWRLWDVKGIERWQYVLLIESNEAESKIWEGAGSCPIIVSRWRTDSTTAWGTGAAQKIMPTVKTLDQLCYLIMKHLSFAVDPAGFYDDDGTINLDNGLTPGDMIPRAAGSKIEAYESKADFDTSFFERKEMQLEIKRAFFQDKPQQTGDTPPTAAQWMDQKAEIARRIGSPLGRITTEWQWAIFQRFSYLMEKRGTVQPVKLNGDVVRLRAQSPLIKAQRQQSVMIAERLLQAITQIFGPQMTPLIVDMIKTSKNLQDRLGDTVVVLRTEGDIAKFMEQAAALAQQNGLLPAPGEGQAPPIAPPQAA